MILAENSDDSELYVPKINVIVLIMSRDKHGKGKLHVIEDGHDLVTEKYIIKQKHPVIRNIFLTIKTKKHRLVR